VRKKLGVDLFIGVVFVAFLKQHFHVEFEVAICSGHAFRFENRHDWWDGFGDIAYWR